MAAFDSAQIRAICEWARELAPVRARGAPGPAYPDPRRLRLDALSWLAGIAWYWAWRGVPGRRSLSGGPLRISGWSAA